MNQQPISEDDLQAYVDGQLEPSRRHRVECWLADHPEAAGRIAALMVQRDALRAALAPVAAEPIPMRLDLRRFTPRARWHRARWQPVMWHGAMRHRAMRHGAMRPLQALAASIVLVCAGGFGGWQLRDHAMAPKNGISALAREAADTYAVFAPDRLHPVEVAEPVQLGRWVGSRLNRPVGVPDLDAAGFHLLGGRIVPTPHGAAGLYLYENAQGMRLGVLLRPMTIDKTATMAEHDFGDLSGFSWADEGLGYSLVGSAPAAILHPVANEIRRQATRERS